MQQSWHFSPVCHCKRPLRLALLASSPKGGAKGRALPARCTEIFAPGFGGAVDKTGWVRYTIDEKGTTSKAVPQSELRDNRCFGVLAVISYYLPVKQRQ